MAEHATDMWLERIAGGFFAAASGDTTIRSLGAYRWVVEDLETRGFIRIGFPYSQVSPLTVTDEGHRYLNRRHHEQRIST